MQVETLADVLDWTRAVHANLAACLEQGSPHSRSERARMLFDYLAEHEHRLQRVLELSKEDASDKALNTWCYDYFENAPISPGEVCGDDMPGMETDEIIDSVMQVHETVIGLYRYLIGRAESPSTQELVSSLLDREESETKLMARDAGQVGDL